MLTKVAKGCALCCRTPYFIEVDEILIPSNSSFTLISIPVLHTSVQSSLYNVELYSCLADVRKGFVTH